MTLMRFIAHNTLKREMITEKNFQEIALYESFSVEPEKK